ncbi:MAG TPA: DapH/DapD/GlmU-related protein [Acidimicrobiales bacterium]|nr:DapH/DapD/GlmU-related protein [Acidimicrobiales bacterium]
MGSDWRVPPWVRRPAAAVIDASWRWVGRLGAIGPDDRRGRRFGAFGEGSVIAFPPGAIYNERWIRIGAHTMIGPHVSLTAGMAPGQEMVSDPVVRIGDRTLIGQGSYIVGHFCIEIGDDVQTGPYVYITDQNHTYADPDLPIGRQWPVESKVTVGSGSWLGAGVIVLPGARIGRNVAVGAGSVVVDEVPDHCVAVGVPAQVVKRYVAGEGWVATHGRAGAGTTEAGTTEAGTTEAGAPPADRRHNDTNGPNGTTESPAVDAAVSPDARRSTSSKRPTRETT